MYPGATYTSIQRDEKGLDRVTYSSMQRHVQCLDKDTNFPIQRHVQCKLGHGFYSQFHERVRAA